VSRPSKLAEESLSLEPFVLARACATLANNGGPTETELPQAGSSAIDAGNPAAPGTSPPQLCPLFDQRNVPRPRDGNHDGIKRCDIGAVEA